MKRLQRSVVVGIAFGLLILANRLFASDAVQQKPHELNRTVKVTVTMKYLLYLPKGYEQKPSWPLVLFLHGAGERGDDLDLVKARAAQTDCGRQGVSLYRRIASVPSRPVLETVRANGVA